MNINHECKNSQLSDTLSGFFSNKPEDAVEIYRQRGQIETMFKAMKSAGFNIEATHLSDIERIEKLLLIVMRPSSGATTSASSSIAT